MSVKKFKGTGVALVTPFNSDGTVDFDSLEKLVKHVSDNGVDFLVALGTTAETPTLSFVERCSVLEHISDVNKKKLPLVVGLGGNNTQAILDELDEYPLELVDAILCVSPYYNKPSQEGIFQHFLAIGEATPVPIIIYNVPGRTGSNTAPETILRLTQANENFIAVKEAAGNMAQSMQLVKMLPNSFSILSGDDDLVLSQIAAGFDGVISVAANCWTKDFSDMVNLSLENKFDEARTLHYKLLDGISLLFKDGNPPGVKAVLRKMGICKNKFRLPVVPVSESTEDQLLDFIEQLS